MVAAMLPTIAGLNQLVSTIKPDAPPTADNYLEAMRAQLAAMAKRLKDDEDLVVYFSGGGERMRVFDVESDSSSVVLLHGLDSDGSRTTALVHASSLQFFCKFAKLKPQQQRRPVGFHITKPGK